MPQSATRTILAFGDSLTWGVNPGRGGRHDYQDRWPSIVEAGVRDVRVVAEGLAGRTASFDDYSAMADRNGVRTLPMLLGSHYPLDLVIIMFGANDLKPHICGHAAGAAAGIERCIEIAKTYPYGYGAAAPRVLVVSPPHFCRTDLPDQQPAGGRSIAESEKLAPLYREIARRRGVAFFDAATVAQASPVDGVHLDAANTRAIGMALVGVVAEILGQ
jgi:lysophospholipase L1-like esterase